MAESEKSASPPADGAAFSFRGKEYFLPRLVQADRKAFRLWCGVAAVNEVADMEPLVKSGDLSAERYGTLCSVTQGRVTAGYYWWDEPGGVFWRGTGEGFVRLCLICFRRHDPKAAEDDVRAMAATVDRRTGRSLLDDKYAEANADPTAPRPSAAGGGGSCTAGSSGSTG